eukprot:jgi/Bigna1/139561/aug1.51_g14269
MSDKIEMSPKEYLASVRSIPELKTKRNRDNVVCTNCKISKVKCCCKDCYFRKVRCTHKKFPCYRCIKNRVPEECTGPCARNQENLKKDSGFMKKVKRRKGMKDKDLPPIQCPKNNFCIRPKRHGGQCKRKTHSSFTKPSRKAAISQPEKKVVTDDDDRGKSGKTDSDTKNQPNEISCNPESSRTDQSKRRRRNIAERGGVWMFTAQLKELRAMGFKNTIVNLKLLNEFNGDVQKVMDVLISGDIEARMSSSAFHTPLG